MAKFKLELGLRNPNYNPLSDQPTAQYSRILLADFDSNNPNNSNSISFNEQLTEEVNDNYTLSFSMPERVNEIDLSKVIQLGRVLFLTFAKPQREVMMVITTIKPNTGGKGINRILDIEARDYASYTFARNNVGLFFDTFEDEDYNNFIEEKSWGNPLDLVNISNYILVKGWLYNDQIEKGWTTTYIGNEPTKLLSFEINDSNTYNALTTLAEFANCFIRFNYRTQTIYFFDKSYDGLDKNFTILDTFNQQQIDVSYTSENLYNLFFVQGAENEFGINTILANETTYGENFIYNFDYYVDNGLLNSSDREYIESAFGIPGAAGYTGKNLTTINQELRRIIEQKYDIIEKINQLETAMEIAAEQTYAPNLLPTFALSMSELETHFKIEEKDDEIPVGEESITIPVELGVWDNFGSSLPAPIADFTFANGVIRYDGRRYFLNSSGGNGSLPFVLSFTSGTSYTYNHKGRFNTTIRVSGTGFDIDKLEIVRTSYVLKTPTVDYKTDFPYFELLFLYGGSNYINRRQKNWLIDRIDVALEWHDELEDEKLDLENQIALDPPNVNSLKANLASVESQLEDIRKGFGVVEVVGGVSQFSENQRSKWTHLNYFFEKHKPEFLLNAPTIEPIMTTYNRLLDEKRDFWFNLRNKFGGHLFAEGIYENQIETDAASLLAQAEAVYTDHKLPNENISVSYIDLSNIVGIDIADPQVGDYIVLINDHKLVTTSESKLEVSAITRTLRSDGGIEISILRYNMIDKILSKIIAAGNNA